MSLITPAYLRIRRLLIRLRNVADKYSKLLSYTVKSTMYSLARIYFRRPLTNRFLNRCVEYLQVDNLYFFGLIYSRQNTRVNCVGQLDTREMDVENVLLVLPPNGPAVSLCPHGKPSQRGAPAISVNHLYLYRHLGISTLAESAFYSSTVEFLTQTNGNSTKYSPCETDLVSDYNYKIKFPRFSLLFYEIPKNASSTIKTVLFSLHEENRMKESYSKFMGASNWQAAFPHMVVHSDEAVRLPYVRFAFLRNPYERIVSAYFNIGWKFVHKDVPFKEFVARLPEAISPDGRGWDRRAAHFKPVSSFIPQHSKKYLVDFIGRVENFGPDFRLLLYSANITPPCRVPKINSTRRGSYRQYYSAAEVRIVSQLYGEDIELGKYTF